MSLNNMGISSDFLNQSTFIEIESTFDFIRQVYPGQYLPSIPELERYPDPNNVCNYLTKEEFRDIPKWQSQWVHWEKQCGAIIEGNYFDLTPIHFEGIFTLICNLRCPHCTQQNDRRILDTWQLNAIPNEHNTLSLSQLFLVIDQITHFKNKDPLGIVWGGGDPTCNPDTYAAMLYAKSKNILSSFITNGVLLDVEKLLEIEPVLVRVSLNCGTANTYNKFHGLSKGNKSFFRTISNIEEFGRKKRLYQSKTLLGVSLVVDERNIDDSVVACKLLSSINAKCENAIDYVIIRPAMQYSFFKDNVVNLNDNTKIKYLNTIHEKLKQVLDSANIPIITIKDSFQNPPDDSFYDNTDCLAYGLFSQVRCNGDIQLCSDSYGDNKYTIGNLLNESIADIWKSERRKNVLNEINKVKCYKKSCPFNSRGHHHNRIFHQIELFRKKGKMKEVVQWIESLKQTTLPLNHSFFI